MNLNRAVVSLSLFLFAAVALACPQKQVKCGPYTDWYELNWLELHVSDESGRGSAKWTFTIDNIKNDYIIEKEEISEGEKSEGTVMIVSGRTMISKGLDLKRGYEIDAVDGPGLIMQLLVNVLGHIVPGGPQAIEGKMDVNHTEDKKPIKVATSSASGLFGVPWAVEGSLEKSNESKVSYNLNFKSNISSDSPYTILMSGNWEVRDIEPIDDNMSLKGWKIYTVGPYSKETGSGTILDYGAQLTESNAITVGALRKIIKDKESAPNK